MKICLIILMMVNIIKAQNLCHIVDNLYVGMELDAVNLHLKTKIKNTDYKHSIEDIGDKRLWFFNKILWRIEVNKKIDLPCYFDKNIAFDDDNVKIVKRADKTIITNMTIWEWIVRFSYRKTMRK